jgi:predicted regulator of Ras-like GTPase activity (Roadblock/LC7/MglB family)
MSDRYELGFLLDDFRRRVPNVSHVVAVSADGLLSAADAGLARDVADRLAAASSGLLSLLRTSGEAFGAGYLSHNLTEYADGFMLSMSAGPGGCLIVLAERSCDLGQVSFEMTALVNRVGDAIVPAARAGLDDIGLTIHSR